MGFLKPTPDDLDDDLQFHFFRTLETFASDPLFKQDPLFRANLVKAVEYVRARRDVVLCRSEFCPVDDYWCGGGKILSSRRGLRRLRDFCVATEQARYYKPPAPLTLRLDE